ncbi:ABC transporter ATP-binding protein [Terrihabitans rhizophilus]|uniref:ABC transporter ATP-binding protein n=1 Tax=Terrihabitans rhizophilus TaxID=3092662 RepID=A0ABU4RLF3_9HYPH|nr:ABC transporter ATP-binding protein [Terrihabitans sp. PJ23]MDX6805654.1 ABC transporter ATP-binding protein [Terrihabitans sp. PJ23]
MRAEHEPTTPATTEPKPHLRFDGVALTRGERRVFDGFSLTLTEPRIGLIGNNGSGKSTLLRLAGGLLMPDAGTVQVHGLDTREHRRDLPRHIGFLFQNPDHQILFPTVEEEISFGMTENGLPTKEAKRQAAALLAEHGCAGWEGRATHALSEGQKQLVCLLAVLSGGPSILLLDEPFSSLDLPTRLDLRRRLRALPQRVVMVTHDFDLLRDFDRLIWLEAGRVRMDGAPDGVLPAYFDSVGYAGPGT